jgi:hypothetical protein
MRVRIAFIACSVAVLIPFGARATIVFSNGLAAADLVAGNLAYSDLDSSVPGQRVADDFSFALPTQVDGITFFGSYFPGDLPTDDAFQLQFYEDDGSGVPGASTSSITLSTSRVDTGIQGTDGFFLQIFEYSATFSPVTFQADTKYWLTVVNDTSAGADDFVLILALDGGRSVYRVEDAGSWIELTTQSLAFSLTGQVVPEPSAFLLLGVAALAGLRRVI